MKGNIMTFTPWYPGHIKPARRGVYQQMSGAYLGYQRWDGFKWFGWATTVEGAAQSIAPAAINYQNDDWRGLTKKGRSA
jgi:hypothetical protein